MKLRLKLSLFILLIFSATNSFSQLLEVNAWNTFEGKIGNIDCQLSIYRFRDNSLKGNYVLKNNGKTTLLTGYTKANAVFLTEAGHDKSSFKGNTFTDTLDKFEGVRSDDSQRKTEPFNFTLTAITWSEYDHKYSDMFGTDEEIEGFMKMAKNAILTGDKQWLADHVHYPTRHVLHKGYTSINNKTQFIKYFDEVFNSEFKNKIRYTYTTNLFHKNGEAMLGDGAIWIGNTSKSVEGKYAFIITAINP